MWMLSFGEGLKKTKISNVNKNKWCGKKQKVPLFFFSNAFSFRVKFSYIVFSNCMRGISF